MSKSDTEHPVGVTAETFDLMDWVESGTVGRRQVTIYGDVEAGKRLADIDARLTELGYDEPEQEDADAPLSAAPDPEVAALLAEAEDLTPKLVASKSVWTVRALSEDEIKATFDPDEGGVPIPKMPVPPPEKAGKKAQEDFGEKVTRWRQASAEADAERLLLMLSAAVVSVETPRGTAEGATVETLRAMRSRPHGGQWIDRLHAALTAATEADVEIPRPTSPGRSTSDLG